MQARTHKDDSATDVGESDSENAVTCDLRTGVDRQLVRRQGETLQNPVISRGNLL